MYFGKPVIATAFSGPEGFLTRTNPCIVGFRAKSIMLGDLYLNAGMGRLYQPGEIWAEPDLQQAAHWICWLADRPAERKRIGEKTRGTVRRSHSMSAVGTAIRSRITQIQTNDPWPRDRIVEQ
jgi:hypothetical protein